MEARTYTVEESTLIERIARIISSVREANADYTRLATELGHAVPFDVFGVVLLRHDRQAVRITVCQREGDDWVAARHQHPYIDSHVAQLIKDPGLRVRNYPDGLDGSPAEHGDALNAYNYLRATLIAPLVVEDRVLGTLELGSIVPTIYDDPTLQRLMHSVAQVVATAIESVQLGGNTAIQDRQRRALKGVTHALTTTVDLATLLQQIVTGISDALNVASAIAVFDRQQRCFRLAASSGMNEKVLERFFPLDLSSHEQCILSQTLLQRSSQMSHDIGHDGRFPDSLPFYTELAVCSMLSAPLVTETMAHGVLFLCSPEIGGFTPLKVDILSLFANQATIAIHNGVLLESVQQYSSFQEAIEQLEMASSCAGNLTPGEELELLARVREETQRTFGTSLSHFLRVVSAQFLSPNGRNFEELFLREEQRTKAQGNPTGDTARSSSSLLSALQKNANQEQKAPFAETLSLLAHTTESALTRAGMLGGLSRLLVQFKQSTNWVKDAWFVVNTQGICTYMNPAAEVLCGQRLESLSTLYGLPAGLGQGQNSTLTIEKIFSKLRPYVRNEQEVTAYLQDFTQESSYRQELRCILAAEPVVRTSFNEENGRLTRLESASTDHYYQFTRYPMHSPQGNLEANALQVQNITEQVRDEKNRSALLSTVSHDLRTPLTTIKAAVTGLLQEGVEWSPTDLHEMLEDINSETDHLTVLVNALVELSRIEMGALLLEKEWCDVVEIVHGAMERVQRTLGDRRVQIQTVGKPPLIHADHAQLRRVFANLLENAAHHSPVHAPIEIVLDVSSVSDMLRVRVIDHGEGIPQRERERIFHSFYSLRSYSDGLGLAICKGIVEAHHGKIEVEAAENGGTCFTFTLPAHRHSIVSREKATVARDHSPPLSVHASMQEEDL